LKQQLQHCLIDTEFIEMNEEEEEEAMWNELETAEDVNESDSSQDEYFSDSEQEDSDQEDNSASENQPRKKRQKK
jgi:hypothetical protein